MTSALKFFQGRFGRVALLDSDHDLVTHAHPQCHVLIKADGCDTSYEVGGRLHPLTRETMVLVNVWEPHAKVHGATRARSTVLALYIEPEWLALIDRRLGAAAQRGFFTRSCVPVSPEVRRLADRLIGGMFEAAPGPEGRRRWEADLCELMLSVVCAFSTWRDGAAGALSADPRPPTDRRIQRAIRFMQENLGGGFTLEELARASHLSRPHFFSLFKRCTAVSPGLFFNTLRMEAAFGQLTMDRVAINAVADRLGFSEPHHFTRFFRTNLGIPPSEYRKTVELFR